MRRTVLASISAALLGAAAVTTVTINSAAADGGSHRHAVHFTVVERALTDTTADTGPAGDSLGDVLAFANPLYNAGDTRVVGSDNGSCVRTAVGKSYECQWTNTLPGGSVMVAGPFLDAGDSTLAVIGGTGRYRGVSGEMLLHARNAAGSEYDFTFSLLRG